MTLRVDRQLLQARQNGDAPSRFLTETECAALAARVAAFRTGGGESRVQIDSTWRGAMRFTRNQIRSSGDRRNTAIWVTRNIEGAEAQVLGNQIDDVSLRALVLRAEDFAQYEYETGDVRFQQHATSKSPTTSDSTATNPRLLQRSSQLFATTMIPPEPIERPKLFFESTFNMSSPRRASSVQPLVAHAVDAGMLASGYIQVSATGTALIDTYGNKLYYPMTEAQYTVTVRDPNGTGSGWAGVDGNDWSKIDGVRLSEIALDKCLQSRNPVQVEPGRYTTILEPQAVHQLFWPIIQHLLPNDDPTIVLPKPGGKALDERITVFADPMDPDVGFLPFDLNGNVYHKATWFDRGLTKDAPYTRNYGIHRLHNDTGLPNSRAYHIASGPDAMDDMIATTERGILVTHFYMLTGGNPQMGVPAEGFTRDGTWLIEKGKVSKPIKNMKFRALQFSVFNAVEQIGPSQRVYSRAWPECSAAAVPSMKVRDFNFIALTDAV